MLLIFWKEMNPNQKLNEINNCKFVKLFYQIEFKNTTCQKYSIRKQLNRIVNAKTVGCLEKPSVIFKLLVDGGGSIHGYFWYLVSEAKYQKFPCI